MKLILLRHGQSEWNRENLFTGWYDSPLSDQGVAEAKSAGKLIVSEYLIPDVIHTSTLKRATQTTERVLVEIEAAQNSTSRENAGAKSSTPIPVKNYWRLNERHYGDLTGLNKKSAVENFGEEQVFSWRRKYHIRPPEISDSNSYSEGIRSSYPELETKGLLPKTECLADVSDRLMPYWEEALAPDLRKHNIVLVSAHGNSLRALIKYLDGMDEDEVEKLNIPTGIPLVYELDEELRPIQNLPVENRYLGDAKAAKQAALEVARQTGQAK